MANRLTSITIGIFIFILFFLSCSDEKQLVQGRTIQLDFSNIEEISPGSWIKIDQWKFTHVRSMKEGVNTYLALPSTYLLIDSLETGNKVGTPIASRSIGLHLASNIAMINNEIIPSSEPKYKILNPGLISVAGILKITKSDSSKIIIETPNNYPVTIKAITE